jgi:hypothetical protein
MEKKRANVAQISAHEKLHNSRRRMRAAHCRSDGIADRWRSNSRGWCGDAKYCCCYCRCGGIQLFQYDALNGPDWIAKTAGRPAADPKMALKRALLTAPGTASALWEGRQRDAGGHIGDCPGGADISGPFPRCVSSVRARRRAECAHHPRLRAIRLPSR